MADNPKTETKIEDVTRGGLWGYVQVHAPDRFNPNYVDENGVTWDAFTVAANDRAVNGDGPKWDAKAKAMVHRERCEWREGWDEEGCIPVGAVVTRSGVIKEAPGFVHTNPKHTFLQPLFDLKNSHPLAFLKAILQEDGKVALTLLVNYKQKDGKKGVEWGPEYPIAYTPGQELHWLFSARLVPGDADFAFTVNGKVICDLKGDRDLVLPNADWFYMKGGLYRSGVPEGRVMPTNTLLHRGWTSEKMAGEQPAPVEPGPVSGPVDPVEPPPVETPAEPAYMEGDTRKDEQGRDWLYTGGRWVEQLTLPLPPDEVPTTPTEPESPVTPAEPAPTINAAEIAALMSWADSYEDGMRVLVKHMEKRKLPHAEKARAAMDALTDLRVALKREAA